MQLYKLSLEIWIDREQIRLCDYWQTSSQATSALQDFKMESPVKKLDLQSESNKENLEAQYESDEVAVPIKGIPELPDEPVEPIAATVAPTIKEEEAIEPILQVNPQRFVLFPIKYHEVCPVFTTRDFTRKVLPR